MTASCKRILGLLTAVSLAVVSSSCAPRVDPAAERSAIHAVDSLMIAAIDARDIDRLLSFFADSASMLGPNAPAIVGKAAIRAMATEMMAAPNLSVIHHPGTIEVSRGGDMAYHRYAYEITVGTVTERGKDLSLFTKQADGAWKLLFDAWSPDAPAAPSPSAKD